MSLSTDETIKVLNQLISICYDGIKGFRDAYEHVRDTHLKSVLSELARERESIVFAFQTEVKDLGGTPKEEGSLMGVAHRLYMDLKSAVSSDDRKSILDEVARGEEYTLSRFQEALDKDLPLDVKSIIQLQYAQVQKSYDRVRALKQETQ